LRRADQPLGVATNIQRVIVGADDLRHGAGDGAELLGGTVGIDAGSGVEGAGRWSRRIGADPEPVIILARPKNT
jgi:hypothetical protein